MLEAGVCGGGSGEGWIIISPRCGGSTTMYPTHPTAFVSPLVLGVPYPRLQGRRYAAVPWDGELEVGPHGNGVTGPGIGQARAQRRAVE